MSNTNILALRTLDDDDLMSVVGGCGNQCQPQPHCQPKPQCQPQPCEIKVDLCLSLCI